MKNNKDNTYKGVNLIFKDKHIKFQFGNQSLGMLLRRLDAIESLNNNILEKILVLNNTTYNTILTTMRKLDINDKSIDYPNLKYPENFKFKEKFNKMELNITDMGNNIKYKEVCEELMQEYPNTVVEYETKQTGKGGKFNIIANEPEATYIHDKLSSILLEGNKVKSEVRNKIELEDNIF